MAYRIRYNALYGDPFWSNDYEERFDSKEKGEAFLHEVYADSHYYVAWDDADGPEPQAVEPSPATQPSIRVEDEDGNTLGMAKSTRTYNLKTLHITVNGEPFKTNFLDFAESHSEPVVPEVKITTRVPKVTRLYRWSHEDFMVQVDDGELTVDVSSESSLTKDTAGALIAALTEALTVAS